MTTRLVQWLRAGRARREAGTVALFIAIVVPVILITVGLVYDFSAKIAAHSHAQTAAQEAARAGAQALTGDAITGQNALVDPDRAVAAAQACLAAAGSSGSVSVSGGDVTVTVDQPWQGRLVISGGTTRATATVHVNAAP